MDRYEVMSRLVCPPVRPKAVIDEASLRTDEEERASYAWSPAWAPRLACGALVGAASAAAGLLPLGPLQKALFCALTLAALLAAVCDLRKRIIPWQLSAAIGALALAWQALAGLPALGLALAVALILALLFKFASVLASLMGGSDSLGGGDMRMIGPVGLACGWPGIVFGGAAALLFSLAALALLAARGKASRHAKVPFGPTLAVWLAFGMALGALVPT